MGAAAVQHLIPTGTPKQRWKQPEGSRPAQADTAVKQNHRQVLGANPRRSAALFKPSRTIKHKRGQDQISQKKSSKQKKQTTRRQQRIQTRHSQLQRHQGDDSQDGTRFRKNHRFKTAGSLGAPSASQDDTKEEAREGGEDHTTEQTSARSEATRLAPAPRAAKGLNPNKLSNQRQSRKTKPLILSARNRPESCIPRASHRNTSHRTKHQSLAAETELNHGDKPWIPTPYLRYRPSPPAPAQTHRHQKLEINQQGQRRERPAQSLNSKMRLRMQEDKRKASRSVSKVVVKLDSLK